MIRFSSSGIRLLAIGLTSAAVVWTAAILCTPRERVRASFPGATALVHASAAAVCHQRPERSFHGDGGQFPVCARCTGLYVSGALGAVIGWLGVGRMPRRVRVMLALAAVPTLITFAAEWLGIAASSNVVRAAAALPLGSAVGWVMIRMLREESSPTACAMIC